MLYRVKQFINGLTAKVTDKDLEFINQQLTPQEKNLFLKLRVSEQYHSLNVAYGCQSEAPTNNKLIKAALLHDVGKVDTNLTIINKSFVVLAKKLKIKKSLLPSFLQKSLEYQLTHPQRGYELLKPLKTEEDILYFVLNHHDYSIENLEMKILQKYDNLN
ncbi:HD domain-containing protein [Alkaliphilus transvaalensis]|uniref:HD domain-containing protein n=1 Tax=Alkaliphilus transvaalensis TaxID=114628 RepID=UPI0004790DB5|nr:HD domain-containing protein [Alkaliphilus transvaalensis]